MVRHLQTWKSNKWGLDILEEENSINHRCQAFPRMDAINVIQRIITKRSLPEKWESNKKKRKTFWSTKNFQTFNNFREDQDVRLIQEIMPSIKFKKITSDDLFQKVKQQKKAISRKY